MIVIDVNNRSPQFKTANGDEDLGNAVKHFPNRGVFCHVAHTLFSSSLTCPESNMVSTRKPYLISEKV